MQSFLGGTEDGFGLGLAEQNHLDQDQKLNWTLYVSGRLLYVYSRVLLELLL